LRQAVDAYLGRVAHLRRRALEVGQPRRAVGGRADAVARVQHRVERGRLVLRAAGRRPLYLALEVGEGGFERRLGAEQGREHEACDKQKRQPGRYAIDAERLLQPATLLSGARTLAAGLTEVSEAGRPRST